MNKNIKRIVVAVTVAEMFKNYMSAITEFAWESQPMVVPEMDHLRENATALIRHDMERIRKMFVDGYTVLLMGEKMNRIDPQPQIQTREVEIRIFNDDKELIGVIVNNEISF